MKTYRGRTDYIASIVHLCKSLFNDVSKSEIKNYGIIFNCKYDNYYWC